MIDDLDPLAVLFRTTDPERAAAALNEIAAAGFTEPERIAEDFGWHVGGAPKTAEA